MTRTGRRAVGAGPPLLLLLARPGGAYGLSYLFDRQADYALLFAVGGGALILALALNVLVGRRV